TTDYLYEPDAATLLDRLLRQYITVLINRAFLEAAASEHGARMTAMDSATNNASDMIDRLTLAMNRARQATITKELMEIVGGAEGLVRGMDVQDTGGPIKVPVGPQTLGRILNVIGEPVDEAGPVEAMDYYPIHRPPPAFVDQAAEVQAFETGIKVVDLLTPYS